MLSILRSLEQKQSSLICVLQAAAKVWPEYMIEASIVSQKSEVLKAMRTVRPVIETGYDPQISCAESAKLCLVSSRDCNFFTRVRVFSCLALLLFASLSERLQILRVIDAGHDCVWRYSYENIIQLRCLLEGVPVETILDKWEEVLEDGMHKWQLDRSEVRVE